MKIQNFHGIIFLKKSVVTIDITSKKDYNVVVITIITTTLFGGITMSNYSKVSVSNNARVELHEQLSLTGAEISINNLPAGTGVPFVHSHKNNEEIYAVLSGKGTAVIDGETVELSVGDWIRIFPSAKRQFSAAQDSSISFICIQVKENSLEGYTQNDAVIDN